MKYIVIMGGGRVGHALANLLIDDGADIALLESDYELSNELAGDLDALVVHGNGTKSQVLDEVNIEDADYFIATTGNDEANLLSCILVRKYNVPHIIARVSNPDHEEAFKEVGIEQVISPERAAAAHLQRLVMKPNVAELTSIGKGDAEFMELTITNDKIIGKRFKDISPSKDFIIISRYVNGKLEIPQPDNTIARGEKIALLVKTGSYNKVEKKFSK